MRNIRNEDALDQNFPKMIEQTLDSHFKSLNVYVFSCVLEKIVTFKAFSLWMCHFKVNKNIFLILNFYNQ